MTERSKTTRGPARRSKQRRCAGRNRDGGACGARPLREGELCFFHDPVCATEAASGRKLGGLHRRRESTVVAAFDLEGLDTIEGAQRLLEVATTDTLGLPNSPARSKILIQLFYASIRLVDVADIDARVERLEASRAVGMTTPFGSTVLIRSGPTPDPSDDGLGRCGQALLAPPFFASWLARSR